MPKMTSKRKVGFKTNTIHDQREPHAFHFLKEKATFWVAALSVLAFVVGNMVGQHGWYVFWASVMGRESEQLIVYAGTTSPVSRVPDYTEWYRYGGGDPSHTYRQVPGDILVQLPVYDSVAQRKSFNESPAGDIYSIAHMGSYQDGGEGTGSHPGIDIRMPVGTPILAVMNGIVSDVKFDAGFGNVVVVKHPNVPDPGNPRKLTTLYSSYAHLSAALVNEGDTVMKGEQIALSGDTGFATGPHLHFQIDRETAYFHPYWPFTSAEAAAAGMSFQQAVNAGLYKERIVVNTVNPMLYVQANFDTPQSTADRAEARRRARISRTRPSAAGEELVERLKEAEPVSRVSKLSRARSRRDERIRLRLARRDRAKRVSDSVKTAAPLAPKESDAPIVTNPTPILFRETVVTTEKEVSKPSSSIVSVEFRHDGSFSGRSWEKLYIRLLDADGNTVENPVIQKDYVLRTAYGEAEFRPALLSELDFVKGVAEVNMLPRGRRTVVVKLIPFNQFSQPLRYERTR